MLKWHVIGVYPLAEPLGAVRCSMLGCDRPVSVTVARADYYPRMDIQIGTAYRAWFFCREHGVEWARERQRREEGRTTAALVPIIFTVNDDLVLEVGAVGERRRSQHDLERCDHEPLSGR